MNGKSMRGRETREVQRRGSQCPVEPGSPQPLHTSWKAGLWRWKGTKNIVIPPPLHWFQNLR